SVETSDEVADLGASREVCVTVALGDLAPADVAVQLVHGRVGQHDELVAPTVTALACDDPAARPTVYRGSVPCDRPGRYGFTIRVAPSHPDLPTPVDLGRLTWA